MKTLMTSMMMVLLISLLAVGAFAQTAATEGELAGDPAVDPTLTRDAETDGTQTQYGPPEGGLIPQSTEKAMEPEEFPDNPSKGNSVRTRDIERSENTYQGEIGAGGSDGDEKAFIDEDGDGFNDYEARIRKGDLAGTMVRVETKGGALSQQRGSADDGSTEKVFGEDGDGDMIQDGALENERQTHGPGEAGPYDAAEGFGDPSDQDVGVGDLVRERGANRK